MSIRLQSVKRARIRKEILKMRKDFFFLLIKLLYRVNPLVEVGLKKKKILRTLCSLCERIYTCGLYGSLCVRLFVSFNKQTEGREEREICANKEREKMDKHTRGGNMGPESVEYLHKILFSVTP